MGLEADELEGLPLRDRALLSALAAQTSALRRAIGAFAVARKALTPRVASLDWREVPALAPSALVRLELRPVLDGGVLCGVLSFALRVVFRERFLVRF